MNKKPLTLREIAFKICDETPQDCITKDDVANALDSLIDSVNDGELKAWYKDMNNFNDHFRATSENAHAIFIHQNDYEEYRKNVVIPMTRKFLEKLPPGKNSGKKKNNEIEDIISLIDHQPLDNIAEDTGFDHSPDFRSVTWSGRNYSFTSRQAQVVEMLYNAAQAKTPYIGKDHILEKLDSPSSRLRDTFRKSPAWGTLIIKGEKQGTYRLNI